MDKTYGNMMDPPPSPGGLGNLMSTVQSFGVHNDHHHSGAMGGREGEFYFKTHISWWEHSSHFRLIGRGVPSVSVVSQLVYKFLWLASPRRNPQVPI